MTIYSHVINSKMVSSCGFKPLNKKKKATLFLQSKHSSCHKCEKSNKKNDLGGFKVDLYNSDQKDDTFKLSISYNGYRATIDIKKGLYKAENPRSGYFISCQDYTKGSDWYQAIYEYQSPHGEYLVISGFGHNAISINKDVISSGNTSMRMPINQKDIEKLRDYLIGIFESLLA